MLRFALECDPVVRVRDVEPNDATVGQDHFVLRDRWRTWETRQRGNQGALEVGLRRSEARRARRQDLTELNDTGAAPRADRGDATGEVRDRGQAPAEAVIDGALEPWWLEPASQVEKGAGRRRHSQAVAPDDVDGIERPDAVNGHPAQSRLSRDEHRDVQRRSNSGQLPHMAGGIERHRGAGARGQP